jgi:hypothetical protein
MEIHQHTHTLRKKFTHYLWEFLMLFLAVFCGFLAENYREHLIEHQREKQFARQLLDDLRADSGSFAKRNALMNARLKKHEAFYQLMTAVQKPTDKQILDSCLPLIYTYPVLVTTGTYNQMKASGGLRYIQNEKLLNALKKYYEILLPRTISASEGDMTYYADQINPFILKYFRIQDIDFLNDSVKTKNPVIQNRTSQTDQELINIIELYAVSLRIRTRFPVTEKINELIDLLKKQYYLK